MKIILLLVSLTYAVQGACQQSDKRKPHHESTRIVYYPTNETDTLYNHQNEYFLALFKLALAKVPNAVMEIKYVSMPSVPQGRSAALIEEAFYDIHWMVSNTERETRLAPIRIPLYKGLIGLRLAFVNKNNPDLLADVTSQAQLQNLVVGQGRDWPDTQILLNSQFNLIATTNTNALFNLLTIERIDYFPRSVIEIWAEHALMQHAKVMVDPHIAIYYPTAVYFFVRKNDMHLHGVIEKGLQIAIDDGSFEALFTQHFGGLLKRANLAKRQIFELDNPFLPKETPLADARLWFDIKATHPE
ncbi:amino acid ABC transporter substrate-binding protein [Paraglaciecola sp.]|uniref:amino acid ABC transporter substrate-binding protein n=1 Tax=Paraglaciecola sp. TaxID=1920173 RepID=UPI00273D555B|nr:amino acid ABC transporter substrate-binding protein [Paraglaciecola sp.]MDP5032271.1 transporter substrate-binding domain-containing protein [Paraglaciecola sp.]